MTREEAIEYFKVYRKIFCEDHLKICPKDSIAYQATHKEKEFYDMAIKALEQEPILDKIRAELIQSIQNGTIKIESGTDMLFRIIELYKAESEVKK